MLKRLFFLFLLAAMVFGQVMSYQGKITDATGIGLNDDYAMTFEIFNSSTGGTALWTESHPSVTVERGLFSVELGSITALELAFDEPYWLQITVDGDVMMPRQKITAEAYAFRSIVADSIAGGDMVIATRDTMIAHWDSLRNIPSDFADGTDDDDLSDNYLSDLLNVDETGVTDGSVLKYNSGVWEIGTDETGTVAVPTDGMDNHITKWGEADSLHYSDILETEDKSLGIGTDSPTAKVHIENPASVGEEHHDAYSFEGGTISPFTTVVGEPWTVTTTDAYWGSQSMLGQDGTDLATSVSFTDTFESAGHISFAMKIISSGTNHIYFAVNGGDAIGDSWDSSIDWTVFTYPINAGINSFHFSIMNSDGISNCQVFVDSIATYHFTPSIPTNRALYVEGNDYSNAAIFNGNVGIGTESPTADLHIDGNTKPGIIDTTLFIRGFEGPSFHGELSQKEAIRIAGDISDYVIAVEDTSFRRISHYWNSTTRAGGPSRYLNTGEEAFLWDIGPSDDPWMAFKYAPLTYTEGDIIPWETHLSLSQDGDLNVLGDVHATAFHGDGSGLTGVTTLDDDWLISGTDVYSMGNVGIGTATPSTDLDIAGEIKFHAIDTTLVIKGQNHNTAHGDTMTSNKEAIRMAGQTSDYTVSIQDGSGRIQHYWNSTTNSGGANRFLVDLEPAFMWDLSIAGDPWMEFKYSHDGFEGLEIPWETHMSIDTTGSMDVLGGITAASLYSEGNIDAVGAITAASLETSGDITASGDVTAIAFHGDGSDLTGIDDDDWNMSGTDVYRMNPVGIGTDAPFTMLQVQGTTRSNRLQIVNNLSDENTDSGPYDVASTYTRTVNINFNRLATSVSEIVAKINVEILNTENLRVQLVSPSGTYCTLVAGAGGTGWDFINTVFDDDAATSILDGSPPFTGNFRPVEPLSVFDGEDPNGIWTFRFSLTAGSATIHSTTLSIDCDATPAITTEGNSTFGSTTYGHDLITVEDEVPGGGATMAIRNSNNDVADYCGIRFKNHSNDDDVNYKAGIFFKRTNNFGRGDMLFAIQNATDNENADPSYHRMVILGNGDVGIGVRNPSYTLEVNGTAAKPGGGSWLTSSDRRLKDIGKSFDRSIDALLNLTPYYYHYKEDNALDLPSDQEYIGLMAQDVQAVIPEAVSQRPNSEFLSLNNDAVIMTMLNAIKEQQKLLEDQKAEIELLKKRVEELEGER